MAGESSLEAADPVKNNFRFLLTDSKQVGMSLQRAFIAEMVWLTVCGVAAVADNVLPRVRCSRPSVRTGRECPCVIG